MKKTGIKATESEFERLKELARNAYNTPCIAMSVSDGLAGRDWATTAWRNASEACHALALSHGLPEITGFYGIDADGEFVET